jgi:hypothetical protein
MYSRRGVRQHCLPLSAIVERFLRRHTIALSVILLTAQPNWDKPPDTGNILADYAKKARLDVRTNRFVHEAVEKISDYFATTGSI